MKQTKSHRGLFLPEVMDVRRGYTKKQEIRWISWWTALKDVFCRELQLPVTGYDRSCLMNKARGETGICCISISNFGRLWRASAQFWWDKKRANAAIWSKEGRNITSNFKALWLRKALYPSYDFKAHPSFDLCWVCSLRWISLCVHTGALGNDVARGPVTLRPL